MAMTVVVTGKIYNGKTFEWKDKNKESRTLFRGRLNYRDRTNGEWYFVDAVCWKDFGNENGLVGFLEEHFSADSDNAPTDKGGQAVEMVGYFRPVKRTKTGVEQKKFRINGKVQTIDVEVEVEYIGYEFVIETVDFPPTSEKFTGSSRSKKKDDEIIDFDDEDTDEDGIVELVDEEDEDDDTVEEVEEEVAPTLTSAQKRKLAQEAKKKSEAKKKASTKKNTKVVVEEDEDDDSEFFDQ